MNAHPVASLFVLGHAAFVLFSSLAQAGTLSEAKTFSTASQSIWTPGSATLDINKSYFLGPSWGDNSYALWGSIPTTSAFGAMHLHPGRIGLEASFQATSGGVDIDVPVDLTFNFPSEVEAGAPFSVTSAFARKPNPKMDIRGFGAEFKVDAVADFKATWGGGYDNLDLLGDAVYTADHGGPTSLPYLDVFSVVDPYLYQDDLTLISTGGEKRVSLISIGPGTGVEFEIPGFNVAGISAQVPEPLNQSTMQYDPMGNLHTAATGDQFLSLNLDAVKLTSLIAQAFSGGTIPPLSAELEFESLSTKINYALLDITLSAGPAMHQDLKFLLNGFDVTLTASDGQMATGKMGDSFNFVAPADGSDLDFTAAITIDQQFVNKTGLVLNFGIDVEVLKADLEIFGVTIANFGPLFEIGSDASTSPLFLYTPRPFALQGFNQETMQFRVDVTIPEPVNISLAAILLVWVATRRANLVCCKLSG